MQFPKSWVISVVAVTFLAACTTSPADKQRDCEAAEKALAERNANRAIDISSLESALLSAGGTKLESDSAFPELRKTLLLKGENIGSLAPNYRNGQAAKWSRKFYQWCRKQGGEIELHSTVEKGPIGMFENGPVNKLAREVASRYRTDPYETEFCFDEEALKIFGKREPIASFTVLRLVETSSIQPRSEGIAIVLTGKEIQDADRIAQIASVERQRRDAKAQNDIALVVQTANAKWDQATTKMRNTLRPGDKVAVILQIDSKSYLGGGMVVEVKKPLVSVQFPGDKGGLRWLNISEIYSPDVPNELRCSTRLAGRRCLN